MRTRTTIILGAVFAALVAAYALTNIEAHRQVYKAWEAKRLFSFAPEDVTTLSIAQQGGETIEAVRGADGWTFAGAQTEIPANGALLDQLAAVVAVTTNERPIADAANDPALFELDPPKLVVEAGTKSGELVQLNFGGLDPTSRHRYTQLGDGAVFLARAEIFSALDRNLLALRDRRLFTNLADGLARVDFERLPADTEGTADLEENIQQAAAAIQESYVKAESGEWRIAASEQARARQDRLRLLEAALPQLEAREFIDDPENLGDYGLSTPYARLTVQTKEGTPQVLLLGWIADDAENAGLYVKRADRRSVAIVDARLLTMVPNEPMAFREKRLFTGEAKNLTSIRYRGVDQEFTLMNDAEKGWTLQGAGPGETDQEEVSRYLAVLKMIEGDSFPQGDAAALLGEPRVTLAFDFGTTAPATTIALGAPVPGTDPMQFYARQDFGSITTISFEEFLAIEAQPFDFRVKTFFKFDPATVQDITMVYEGTRYRFAQENGRWRAEEPAGRKLETPAYLQVFLETLAQTAVQGEATPPPSAEVQGAAAPVLEVSVTLAEATPRTLGPIRVGNLRAAESRQRFVTLGGRDGVYYVDQRLVDAARQCVETLR